MKKVKLTIKGMHCGSCAGNIESAVSKVEGVENVSVSVMTNKAIVEMDEGVSNDSLVNVIKKVGYEVVEIK